MDLDNIVVPDDISVQSNEERIVIDPITRVINIPRDYIIGVESDEKSDRMYFQCPKIVGDNVDLSKLKLYVNFENANKERDNYFVDDVTVNEGNILFSWLFSRKVTKYKGNVKFIVCAKKSEDNLTLEWNTTVAKGLSLEGIEVELSDEEQSIASDYLIQLEKELSALAETENNRLLITSSNQITNITNKGSEQVQLVENTAKKALDSIPSTYTDLQKQVNEVEDRELKDANGITQELTITDGYAQLTDTATKRLNSLVIKGNTVQNSTKGYQLFDFSRIKSKTENGVTSTNNNDGSFTIAGTSSNGFDGEYQIYNDEARQILKVGAIKINTTKTIPYFYFRIDDKDNKGLLELAATSYGLSYGEITEDILNNAYKVRFGFYTGNTTNVSNTTVYPMVYQDGDGTFEPYTGGKPSPNPDYPQEVKGVDKIEGKIIGKNLFDINKINSNSNTTPTGTINSVIDGVINTQWNTSYPSADIGSSNSSSGWVNTFNNSIELQPNTYTLSFKHKVIKKLITIDNLRDFFIRVLNKTDNSIITNVNLTGDFAKFKNMSNTFTLNEATSIYLVFSCNNCQIEIKDIQLEIGSTDTSYQPYTEQSISYTLQNPLYRLSDTVYDYIDLNKGKIVRNVGIVEFDGSDDELWNKYSNNASMDGYSVNISNAIDTTPCICNKLLTTDGISTTLEEAIKVLNNTMYVVLNKIRGLNTTELFKSWLQSNTITVYYQLSTPTEEDIPTELLTQLKQLQTYSGETNISFEASDVYPTIDLEYIKDTKKYIESKEELDNQSIIDIDYRVTCLELDMEEQ